MLEEDTSNEILEREDCMALLYSLKSYVFFLQAQIKFLDISNKKNFSKIPSVREIIYKESD
jgi:hypothetical protein